MSGFRHASETRLVSDPVRVKIRYVRHRCVFTWKSSDLKSDPRKDTKSHNYRSINLAISARGIAAMRAVDEAMAEKLLEGVIPMKGRMIHDVRGNQTSQPYGLKGEV
jgi:hypothetical protein